MTRPHHDHVRRVYELSGWNELSQSDRPAGRANVVVVGTRHLLPFRRRRAACERDRGRLSPGHGTARCRMGRALLPSDRPGRPRAQLRQAAAVKGLVSRHDFLDVTKFALKLRAFPRKRDSSRTWVPAAWCPPRGRTDLDKPMMSA